MKWYSKMQGRAFDQWIADSLECLNSSLNFFPKFNVKKPQTTFYYRGILLFVVLIISLLLLLLPLQELVEKCYSFHVSKIKKHT